MATQHLMAGSFDLLCRQIERLEHKRTRRNRGGFFFFCDDTRVRFQFCGGASGAKGITPETAPSRQKNSGAVK